MRRQRNKTPNQDIVTQSLLNNSAPCTLVRAGITPNGFCLFVCWPQTVAHFINEAGSGETVQKGQVSQVHMWWLRDCLSAGQVLGANSVSRCFLFLFPGSLLSDACWSLLLLRRWHQITTRDSHRHFCNSAFLQTENYIQFIVLWQ